MCECECACVAGEAVEDDGGGEDGGGNDDGAIFVGFGRVEKWKCVKRCGLKVAAEGGAARRESVLQLVFVCGGRALGAVPCGDS